MSDEARDWLDALPQLVREAVQLALADLQHPKPVPLEKVIYEADREDARFGVLTVWFADGGGGGFGLEAVSDRAEVIADVADNIQELFHEEREAWAEARPPCPGHAHPAAAETVNGTACWGVSE